MERKKINQLVIMLIIFLLIISPIIARAGNNGKVQVDEQRLKKIETYIAKHIKESKIPGMSIVICDDTSVLYEQQYGYADILTKKEVTRDTYFELGSNSKAFTGLAIRKLEAEGKIKLDDDILQYKENLKLNYEGKYQELKLSNFLYHTSGIPFKSIGDIPRGGGDDALEKTVDGLLSYTLDYKPGTVYSYATINYDVLGYVIQQVTGMSYENYMMDEIFKPLGLFQTRFLYQNNEGVEVSKGYKLSYTKAKEFVSPVYRGNAPAGYISMNTLDLTKWMQLNMAGSPGATKEWGELIAKTHEPDRSVAPDASGSSYASGWNVYQIGTGKIAHGGNNANYSSYIIIRPEDKIGVGILANLNSAYTTIIANEIMDIIEDKEFDYIYKDQYKTVDFVGMVLSMVCTAVIFASLVLIVFVIRDILTKKREMTGGLLSIIKKFGILLIVLFGVGYCVYILPDVLYSGLPWKFVLEWAPFSLQPGLTLLCSSILLFFIYCLLISIFKKEKDMMIFPLTLLSITSGLGNSIIIFTVNEALKKEEFHLALFLYCMLGMCMYVFGQKFVRSKMMWITNQYIYDLRIRLIDRIMRSNYDYFEKLSQGYINSIVNGDTEILSNSPNIIVGGITNFGTLLCCFVYLAILDVKAMLLSIVIIGLAVSVYLFAGRKNNRLWAEARELQDGFYNYINDLISGFKQLKLNFASRVGYRNDVKSNCTEYTDKNTEASVNFVNVFIIGELLFTLVIMSVAFLFPIVFVDIHKSTLSAYVFVFLFMAGPLSGVMNSVPQIIRTKISYERIKDFENGIEMEEHTVKEEVKKLVEINLKIKNAIYNYPDKSFQIGPINCEFNSGEIIFITGGNGSGKTTLLKLLTGLYYPTSGEILLNGELANEVTREYFSNVFSDFHLFKKMYGVNDKLEEKQVQKILKMLEIDDKLSVENGKLSTLNLSTGQRKRVALMVSYMEDKPIYIFDEWAADQDPQFRKFFYEEILFDLKRKGKCIIAITHDERYFYLADKILKRDVGKLVAYEETRKEKK